MTSVLLRCYIHPFNLLTCTSRTLSFFMLQTLRLGSQSDATSESSLGPADKATTSLSMSHTMAAMMCSAVVRETVSKIVSSLLAKDDEHKSSAENIERLEMAHIKMESALHLADKWLVTDVPLLRWRSKLKRATEECDDALWRCKQRAQEDEEIRQSSFPKRIAHATKSFISSFAAGGGRGSSSDEPSSRSSTLSTDVRRFERFADSSTEFLKSVEVGGTPWKYMFFNPLIGHLLSGKSMKYHAVHGSKVCYFAARPLSFADRGVEARIAFVYQDLSNPTRGFYLGFMLRLSESTDILGVIIRCMQSVTLTPRLKSTAECVKRQPVQLPTQDFSWLPYDLHTKNEFWNNVHSSLTQWYRPNPVCCNEHSRHENLMINSSVVGSVFPEEVIVVHLQCHVSLSYHQDKKSSLSSTAEHGESGFQDSDFRPVKVGVLIIPHDSPENMETAGAESYAVEVIGEKEQGIVHTNACLQDLDEKLLPKAINYLNQNSESKEYQLCLNSRHGSAHLYVEKTSAQMQRGRRSKNKTTKLQARKKRVIPFDSVEIWKQVSRDYLKLWVVRASSTLQSLFRSWAGHTELTSHKGLLYPEF